MIFSAIAAVIGTVATFIGGLGAIGTFALQMAAGIGVSYLARALAGKPKAATQQGTQGVQGSLQSSGDLPRAFIFGESATAGSLVYANTWGKDGETPNAYFTQVIALSDLPIKGLRGLWVNGASGTLDAASANDYGVPVTEYRKGGRDHLWVKFYDGTQSTSDSFLVSQVSSVERPYSSTRVGKGISYAVCTSLVEDTLFTGFPSFLFEVDGLRLYDASKDSTNGGAGTHRYSDPATWGGDGDYLPVVQAYNLLRGLSYGGQWLYGLQSVVARRLDPSNWVAQINKCRAPIVGEAGPEQTYRSGGQVTVDAQLGNTIEALLTTCQGKLSEIGGFYKTHVGAPDSPAFSFTDDDILSTEEQSFTPFFGLSDTINGVSAKYPSPDEGWQTKVAPPIYRPDLEALAGGRRLLADVSLDFVPYSAQVQRLMKASLAAAQRARRHTLSLPPPFWLAEPGDVCSWDSVRNGYDNKYFEINGVVDKANLDVTLDLTEVDPADYDWDHEIDFIPSDDAPTIFPRPEPQSVVDWFAEGFILKDADGISRRPAIRLAWDGDMPGVLGINYEVRLKQDGSSVTKGLTDQLEAGSIIVSQSLLPNTAYQARGQYRPSSPREMLWSDWLDVTTPNVSLSIIELDVAVKKQLTQVLEPGGAIEQLRDELAIVRQQVEQALARGSIDKKEIRTQQVSLYGANKAFIETVQTTAASADVALAEQITTVGATVGSMSATITANSSAIATLNGYAAAQYGVTLNVNGYATGFNLVNGGGGTSSFVIQADKFQIQLPGYNGNAPYTFFGTGLVGGVASVGIAGNMVLDGTITASKVNVATLSAIKADMGSITAGTMQSPNGKMLIDLTNCRELFGD